MGAVMDSNWAWLIYLGALVGTMTMVSVLVSCTMYCAAWLRNRTRGDLLSPTWSELGMHRLASSLRPSFMDPQPPFPPPPPGAEAPAGPPPHVIHVLPETLVLYKTQSGSLARISVAPPPEPPAGAAAAAAGPGPEAAGMQGEAGQAQAAAGGGARWQTTAPFAGALLAAAPPADAGSPPSPPPASSGSNVVTGRSDFASSSRPASTAGLHLIVHPDGSTGVTRPCTPGADYGAAAVVESLQR